ncbi:MAG: SsrA-binding protein [Omnitrophica WOR_2 bacterium GWF2_43_52]|nr:MAG: SsrA-binding protein [Omnitrophica WOR_2 bacterium GWA2_44_7]OGX14272.1 MAG: SsrA-binding protein [Omnitrophica WOR_2 bacterium GWC2_44_8]OGX22145.1 MAG: SsrA-binding protein [Omnitrophica WOR_2 bacterium GWF2_43_52]OGX54252.1 MAG: SsrA-binding protein [Omnitrophica WOR_2 bacterium RIFOXYC2_FULL_43_9]HAH20618.1 SsrA-binding protein [Candidatus Omnitrophota bacterium]
MEPIDITTNRKAFRDYEILERLETGIALVGSEVKSLRHAKASLDDAFARIDEGQIFLHNAYIAPYEQASYFNVESKRIRKLLLHRGQIVKLESKIVQRGFSLIPLKMYFNSRGFVKMELALARGKKLYDKREDVKKREVELQMRKMLKNRRNR